LLDGHPVPLESVAPDRIAFQAPWDTEIGTHRLEISAAANSLFEVEPLQLDVPGTFSPYFERLPSEYGEVWPGERYALAAHTAFGALVSPRERARPGEIIHLYMIGLGPVTPPVATGEAPSAVSPARLTEPLACSIDGAAAAVLFAGLAPGYPGHYQVTLGLPENVAGAAGRSWVRCETAGASATAWLPLARARRR
jgi:uncharacterized protein (TIGR03437 family)